MQPPNPSGEAIASFAENLVGGKYMFGGNTPSQFGGNGVDCSGLVNFTLKHLGLATPSGPRPVVVSYWHWNGAVTVPGAPEAGDLVLWPGIGPTGHIGFAINSNQMVSALNPSLGIAITPIRQTHSGNPIVRRLIGVTSANVTASGLPAGCLITMLMPILIHKRKDTPRRLLTVIESGQ